MVVLLRSALLVIVNGAFGQAEAIGRNRDVAALRRGNQIGDGPAQDRLARTQNMSAAAEFAAEPVQ